MKKIFAAILWTGAWCIAALADGTPILQFDQTVYDFGKTSQVETVSGIFKFRNTGDGVLKIEPPKPSCGCTVAELKPDTLQPGESGELLFTLNLGRAKAQLEKHISVKSNDPQTPEFSLIIKADYTPLYEINPATITPLLTFGVNHTEEFSTVTRTDGQPLHIVRLDPSKPWITANVEPSAVTDAPSARIRIAIERDGEPRHFNEFVQIYTDDHTNTPVSSIFIYGQIMGEISLSPEALYWSVPDATNMPADRPESLVLRKVTIRSLNDNAIELKNPQSSIAGIKVELVPTEAGKAYDLIARLVDAPTSTINGSISFETSIAAQPMIQVPVIINVFKP